MSAKTKIVVLHRKEIIYTTIFVVLGILLLILLIFMFFPKGEKNISKEPKYVPGIYTSTITVGNTNLEIEVSVDSSHINAIRCSNLDESVTTMYPLVQPAIESIATQICETQSLENITHSEENPYTSQVILNAIEDALKKAEVTE